MKNWLFCIFLFLPAILCAEVSALDDTKQNPDYLYDLQSLPEITITLTEQDWNTYLNNFDQWPDNGLYVPAQWEFQKDGQTFRRDSVGLRPRGNTSRRRPESQCGEKHRNGAQWHHAHFGVKFTEYESGERFFGADRVILKWCKDDPTYVHEIFSYDLMHRFGVWSAPRASYCRLSFFIEGDSRPVYLGVYLLIENPRKGWLKWHKKQEHIPDNDGNLWKASWGADLCNSSENNDRMGISDDYGYYTPVYDLKLDKDSLDKAKTELHNFIHTIKHLQNGSQACQDWLDENIDVDLVLRAFAVNVMIGHWDDYWVNQNNYYFYFDLNHRFYYIPFDLDNTLGTGQTSFCDPARQNPLYWGNRTDGKRPLIQKILSIPEYEDLFKCYLKELAVSDSLMLPSAAMKRVQNFQDFIRDYLTNDTGEDMEIRDEPASWGNYGQYRLLSGGVGTNFFLTKVASLNFEANCTTSIDEINEDNANNEKRILLVKGRLYIQIDDKIYDIIGNQISQLLIHN